MKSGCLERAKVLTAPQGSFDVHRLPIIETAKEAIGKAMVAHILSLGAIVGLSNVVSHSAIERAILARVPKGTEELNRRALRAGFSLVSA